MCELCVGVCWVWVCGWVWWGGGVGVGGWRVGVGCVGLVGVGGCWDGGVCFACGCGCGCYCSGVVEFVVVVLVEEVVVVVMMVLSQVSSRHLKNRDHLKGGTALL